MSRRLECVDQLVSAQPGQVPQSSGYLTSSRVWACNVFIDVHSEYCLVFMLLNTTLDQMLKAKQAFEKVIFKHSVKVKACRADDGRFANFFSTVK